MIRIDSDPDGDPGGTLGVSPLLADRLPTGVAAVDERGRQSYVNPAFARMVGWPVDELTGRLPPYAYWPPEEYAAIEAAFIRTVSGQDVPEGFDLRFMRRDGTRFDVRVSVAAIHPGQRAGWVASVVDITDRTRADAALQAGEERLRLAMEAGRLGTWDFDVRSGRVVWSATLERIHGLAEGTFGGTFEDYRRDIHPEDLERVLATIGRTTRGEGPHELLYRIVQPGGAVRWLEAHGQLLLDRTGEPARMVGVCTDVTERVEAESVLRHAREEAERANRSKAEFLAAMSHELRTPLNAISGYLDLLDLGIHGPITDGQRQALARVKRNQEHLLRLINDILNFAKVEAGRIEFDRRRFEVASVLAELEPLVAPQAQARGMTYTCASPAPGLCAWADPERVQQILLNLVGNAIKFTDRGGSVTVFSDAAGSDVRIHVRDTGRGIPAERLESIFDPFVQVERQRNETSQQGVGLGLAISRDLARGMGGDLTAASEPGHGSTFTLILPATTGNA